MVRKAHLFEGVSFFVVWIFLNLCFLQLGNVNNTFINTFYFGLVKINFESLYESDNFPFEIASGGDTKARTAVLVVKDKIFIR